VNTGSYSRLNQAFHLVTTSGLRISTSLNQAFHLVTTSGLRISTSLNQAFHLVTTAGLRISTSLNKTFHLVTTAGLRISTSLNIRVVITELERGTCLENYIMMLDWTNVAIIIYYLYQQIHIYIYIKILNYITSAPTGFGASAPSFRELWYFVCYSYKILKLKLHKIVDRCVIKCMLLICILCNFNNFHIL
jgi:hypothetical protein